MFFKNIDCKKTYNSDVKKVNKVRISGRTDSSKVQKLG